MTNKLTNLILACGASCILAVAVNAASYVTKVNIPFAFELSNGSKVAAGAYTVRENSNGIASFSNSANGRTVYLGSNGGAQESKGPARLVFHRYDDQYFLAEIWGPDHIGRKLQPSKNEKRLMSETKEAAVFSVDLRTVAVE